MGLTFALAVLVALLGAIFRSEFEAGVPWLAERLRRLALKSLKGELRERLDEEWSAFLTEMPTPLSKLAAAFGFLIASGRMNLDFGLHLIRAGTDLALALSSVAMAQALCAPMIGKTGNVSEITLTDVTMARLGQRIAVRGIEFTLAAADGMQVWERLPEAEYQAKVSQLIRSREMTVQTLAWLNALGKHLAGTAKKTVGGSNRT